uniref:Uncharacterized protein n=1 Tax=Ditylenchus dipsaci TaxID=166011 RepID=A0A915DAW5_9BILA
MFQEEQHGICNFYITVCSQLQELKKILELWDSGSAPISVHADTRDAEQYSKDVSKIITQLLPWPMQEVEDLGVQLLSSLLFRLQTMTVVPDL